MDLVAAFSPVFSGHGLTALLATLAVLAVCVLLGSINGPGGKASDLVVGVGFAGGLLAVWGVAGLNLSFGAGLIGVAALGGVALAWRNGKLPGGLLWATLLVLVPFLLIASQAIATMWDDYFHWLPNAAYVWRNDHLPGPGMPESLSKWPAYPYTMPFIVAFASKLAGRFMESAGPVANVAFLGAFGAMVVETALEGRWVSRPVRWLAAAVGAGIATVVNPAFSHDVVHTSYADTATAVVVAVCGVVGVVTLNRVAEGRAASGLAWRFGLVATALVNLKQANLVLLVLIVGSLGVVTARLGRRVVQGALPHLPTMVIPPMALFVLWRIQVARIPVTAETAGEMSFRSIATWNFDALGMIAYKVGSYMIAAPLFYVLMYAATWMGLVALATARLDTPARRLLAVVALCWIGYNAFLLLVYLGAMTKAEAEMAADYWRYAPHLGLMALAAVALRFAEHVDVGRRAPVIDRSSWIAAPLLALALAPVAAQFTPLAKAWPMHYRKVGREAALLLPDGARVGIYIGHNLDAMAVALRYDISGQSLPGDRGIRGQIVWHGAALPPVMDEFRRGELTHMLITDGRKPMDDAERDLGLPHLDHETALFAWTGQGWEKVRSWPAVFKD